MIIARTERLLAAAATAAGIAAWVVFLRADLVLSHYDAKAHLVVARRIVDNITPGWKQIGAVWLPLPHLINLLPTQIDFFYRTGAFASAVSIACFGLTAWAAARIVLDATGSRAGAATATALLALNPNLLYLQATPMTEPLLLATTLGAVLWLGEWVRAGAGPVPTRLAVALLAAAWSRYEAWPVLAAALTAATFSSWRTSGSVTTALADGFRVAVWPAAAVVAFLCISRATVGHWFVTGGFFVEDPLYVGQPVRDVIAVWWGTHRLSGYVTETVAGITAIWMAWRALTRRDDAPLLIPVSLFACIALPIYAFYDGHPFRVRYMIPSVAACALFGGLAVGAAANRLRGGAASTAQLEANGPGHRPHGASVSGAPLLIVLLIAATLIESPPWRGDAAMLEEAQWDRPYSAGRRAVTACLAPNYHGEKILASMGSLAHYMQELSAQGFTIADFINEGNGLLWSLALDTGAARHAGWMLVEERAEGGDVLAQRLRTDPSFARGMTRVCDGGGVVLYRRDE